MKITQVSIHNFRCLKSTIIKLSGICLLIGENDSGKTTILQALLIVFRKMRPLPDDIYTNDPSVPPKERDPFEIEVFLEPDDFDTGFSIDEQAIFTEHFDLDDNGKARLRIKMVYGWNAEDEEFRYTVKFQKNDGDGDDFSGRYSNKFGVYIIDALRDIDKEIRNRSGVWGRLLSTVALPDEIQAEISDLFDQANEKFQTDEGFQRIKERFESLITGVLGLSDDEENVKLTPIPQDPAQIMMSSDLHVRNRGSDLFVPISRHGLGSKSAAVIAMFRTWVELRDIPFIFFGFEEPEAHLHPHIQRYLFDELTNLGSQVFITTHSTYIADKADIDSIVLLKRDGDSCTAKQIPEEDSQNPGKPFLTDDFKEKIKRKIEGSNSELFFARCLLLVEGDSERLSIPIFAKALGINFDRLGLSLLSVDSSDYAPYVRLCHPDSLDIDWVLLSDGDAQRKIAHMLEAQGYLSDGAVKKALQTDTLEDDVLIPNDCYILPAQNLEKFFLGQGFVAEYLQAIEKIYGDTAFGDYVAQRTHMDATYTNNPIEDQVYDFIRKYSKPVIARAFTDILTNNGTDDSRIPDEIKKPIIRSTEIATQVLGG